MISLSRRRFVQSAGVAGLGLVARCGRLPWQAPPQLPRLGILSPRAEPTPEMDGELLRALRERGWVEGQTLAVERRFTGNTGDALSESVAQLILARPDIIVTLGNVPTRAVKAATTTIPIVMVGTSDPVGEGLIASLPRPGGNVTGASFMGAALAGKRLELLAAMVPALNSVAYLTDPDATPGPDRREVEAAAGALGSQLHVYEVSQPYDFEAAFAAATRERVDGMVVASPSTWSTHRPHIADLAQRSRLPTVSAFREYAQVGGLMAYGIAIPTLWRGAATYVDKILKGAKPADLPVEQPREFEFVINLKTANALGLTIPQHVLLQATEVIQ